MSIKLPGWIKNQTQLRVASTVSTRVPSISIDIPTINIPMYNGNVKTNYSHSYDIWTNPDYSHYLPSIVQHLAVGRFNTSDSCYHVNALTFINYLSLDVHHSVPFSHCHTHSHFPSCTFSACLPLSQTSCAHAHSLTRFLLGARPPGPLFHCRVPISQGRFELRPVIFSIISHALKKGSRAFNERFHFRIFPTVYQASDCFPLLLLDYFNFISLIPFTYFVNYQDILLSFLLLYFKVKGL